MLRTLQGVLSDEFMINPDDGNNGVFDIPEKTQPNRTNKTKQDRKSRAHKRFEK